MSNQAYCLRGDWTFVVFGVAPVGCGQRDDLFHSVGAKEVAHAGEAGVARLLDAHAKADAALVQHGHPPAAWIAAVHQQQVAAVEQIEVLKQHLAFTLVDAVQ